MIYRFRVRVPGCPRLRRSRLRRNAISQHADKCNAKLTPQAMTASFFFQFSARLALDRPWVAAVSLGCDLMGRQVQDANPAKPWSHHCLQQLNQFAHGDNLVVRRALDRGFVLVDVEFVWWQVGTTWHHRQPLYRVHLFLLGRGQMFLLACQWAHWPIRAKIELKRTYSHYLPLKWPALGISLKASRPCLAGDFHQRNCPRAAA